jgi:hypothetical protein
MTYKILLEIYDILVLAELGESPFTAESTINLIAPLGQLLAQVPHSMQIVVSICAFVAPSDIAWLSHPAIQAPHSTQSSVTI